MDVKKSFTVIPNLSPDPRIRVFRSTFSAPGEFDLMEVDAYVIVTERMVVFSDTLLSPEDMEQMCTQLGGLLAERQILVINSHADWDHVWGNRLLAERYNAPIIGHTLCRTRMLAEESREILHEYQEKFPFFRSVTLIPPTLTFSDTLTLYGGDLTLQLMHAPGHQYDQIALWLPEIKLLLAFDAVEFPIPGIEAPDLVPAMFNTLEQLAALQPDHMLCSHGNTIRATLLNENLRYLREIESRCHALLERQSPAEEALTDLPTLISYPYEEIIAGLTGTIDHTYYDYVHTQNIHHILSWLLRNGGEIKL